MSKRQDKDVAKIVEYHKRMIEKRAALEKAPLEQHEGAESRQALRDVIELVAKEAI
jgi:hypothetical protein